MEARRLYISTAKENILHSPLQASEDMDPA